MAKPDKPVPWVFLTNDTVERVYSQGLALHIRATFGELYGAVSLEGLVVQIQGALNEALRTRPRRGQQRASAILEPTPNRWGDEDDDEDEDDW